MRWRARVATGVVFQVVCVGVGAVGPVEPPDADETAREVGAPAAGLSARFDETAGTFAVAARSAVAIVGAPTCCRCRATGPSCGRRTATTAASR